MFFFVKRGSSKTCSQSSKTNLFKGIDDTSKFERVTIARTNATCTNVLIPKARKPIKILHLIDNNKENCSHVMGFFCDVSGNINADMTDFTLR